MMGERGSTTLLRFAVWFRLTLGRPLTALILYPTALYFFLTSRAARTASRGYLQRLYRKAGAPETRIFRPRWWHTFLHILSFSENTLDRFCFWAGRYEHFDLQIQGSEHLMEHVHSSRGAVLLGAHLGSFDVLRVLASEHGIVVNVVMFTGNAPRINAMLKELDSENDLRIIEIDPGSVRSVFEVKRCLDRGEFVGILGDRVGFEGRGRSATADFLGESAVFPQSPFLLSIILRAPVLFTVALRVAPASYRVVAEPFWDGRPVPRSERARVVQECVESFASLLERYCAKEPLQWFNFYDFWAGEEHGR